MTIVAGVDVGSVTAKTVLLDGDQNMIAAHVVYQGFVNEKAARRCFFETLEKVSLDRSKVDLIVATGYGRELVGFQDLTVTEISCHADGAAFVLPGVRTVVDIGGQDSKVIGLDENGVVFNFRMNDRCAAGTGRFLEVMAGALQLPLNEVGPLALRSEQPAKISSTCAVFAESEIVSLMAQGIPKMDIVAGMHAAICRRISGMVRGVGLRERVAMTGGVAKNIGVVRQLEQELGTTIVVPQRPQIIGALGAARFALREIGRLKAIKAEELVGFDEMAAARVTESYRPAACSDCSVEDR
jgi:(R)-2-hydroxyacyl-CoA dehydratese activating ATPase